VRLPENIHGPPRQAESAPAENGTPTDRSNVNVHPVNQHGNATLLWPPLNAALSWAADGHLVIPLKHGKNRPHGLLLGKGWSPKAGTAGSRDPEQITAWWQSDPSAVIGIVTGVSPLSRVLVIDIDTKPGKPNGWESIFHLMEEYGPLPETTSVVTPSGGMHLYYAMPEGEPPVRCRVGWLPGVDIPWQVPVPPSAKLIMQDAEPETAEDYVYYQFARIVDPLPIAPAWLLADIRNRRTQSQRLSRTERARRHAEALLPTEPGQSPPSRTGGVGGHAEALPPTELFIENGLGWFTGSRDYDCLKLARRLWSQYGDEAEVVGVIFKAGERSPAKDHPFSWQDAYHKIKQAERYWLEDREHILRRAESLIRGFR
jgi:Bifunctional DNA primase/polymerase, N-terminal